QELVRWREDRARRANMPRSWVAENEILVALAKARPRSVNELRAFRGIGPKEIDRSGEIILDAIDRGARLPKDEANLPVRNPDTADVDAHALDLLKAYLSFLSSRYDIAPRFLLRTGKAADLIVYGRQDPQTWVEKGILSTSALRVIGRDLQDFVSGKLQLGLRNGRVEITHTR
ncbi:HRDC domain-containing protein, partial [bacterium]|nr:HRDC domain-containing protein [bacterium]